MSDAGDATGSQRSRPTELVDRFFPIAWIVLYLLLPVTGAGAQAFETNYDQRRDVEALRSLIAQGRADAIDDDLIGPAYIGTAALVHDVTGLSPEDSLIALTRASYVLAVAGCLLLVRRFVRRLPSRQPAVSLTAQITVLMLVFSAGTWHWSDIAWSQFYAAFLGVAFYVARFVLPPATVARSGLTALVLALLALTRSFEFLALVAAWVLGLAVLAVLGRRAFRRPRAAQVAVAVGVIVATTALVSVATGKHGGFLLYGAGSEETYGDLLPAEVAPDVPTFDLARVPLKLVQLFLDPCFYSICSLVDYADIKDSWRLPLAVQLPALVALPLCALTLVVLVVRHAKRRRHPGSEVQEVGMLAELTVAASGLTLGYVASTWASSSALRFGFARDFLLPSLLVAVVAVALVWAGVFALLEGRRRRVRARAARLQLSPAGALTALTFVGAIALIAAVVGVRSFGLPRLDGQHLRSVEYRAECSGGRCDIEIEAVTVAGQPISIPRRSLLTFGCGPDRPRFTLYASDPTRGVVLPRSCLRPRLVAAWPTVMGVPPNSDVLRVVDVASSVEA